MPRLLLVCARCPLSPPLPASKTGLTLTLTLARWGGAGVVTTLVTAEQLPQLQAMAEELGIEVTQVAAPAPELPGAVVEGEELNVDAAKRGLEDLFNLF